MDTLLNEYQINKLNDYLSLLIPGSTISIEATAYNTQISRNIIEEILIKLSDFQVLNTLFVLKCDNEDFDFVHTYAFETYEQLINFVKTNDGICPDCNSEFLESNTELFFIIPLDNIKKVF